VLVAHSQIVLPCLQNALAVPDEGGAIKVYSSCQVRGGLLGACPALPRRHCWAVEALFCSEIGLWAVEARSCSENALRLLTVAAGFACPQSTLRESRLHSLPPPRTSTGSRRQ
jgi:hypothetical protein